MPTSNFENLPEIIYTHACEGESWDEQLQSVAMEISEWPEANIDYNYDKIKKKILASEPPHAGELESHVKFAKVWGGGKQQPIIHDI